jgi:thiol-disulfide isomerase/thioredoxin
MKTKMFLTIVCVLITINTLAQTTSFDYVIKGNVTGQQTGNIYLFGAGGRVGDEIKIPFEDGEFEYKGTSSFLYTGLVAIDDFNNLHELVIEPGETILEVKIDSLNKKYNIISGRYNLDFQQANRDYLNFVNPYLEKLYSESTPETDKELISDTLDQFVYQLVINNWDNYAGIYFFNRFEKIDLFTEIDKSEFINNHTEPLLRQSSEFRELTSKWIKEKDSINLLNHKAYNFKLSDNKGEIIEFNDIAEGKVTFVEKSGSWCGNLTNTTRSYKPIYKKYHDYGFDIITFVNELKYDRWLKWTEEENYPWTTVIELESNDSLFEHILFDTYMFPANYLVNEEGIIIAKSLSAEALNEMLMQKFEPENYQDYLNNKWVLPESTYILDKENEIKSLKELTDILQGKPLYLDCWATWCAPCFEEFKHNEELKSFLKSEGIEMVYINFDDNIDEAKWLNSIRTNNLTGYHLRANESLIRDLVKNGFNNRLPSYMIINKEGDIVESNAFRPSDKEKLYEQFKSLLKE